METAVEESTQAPAVATTDANQHIEDTAPAVATTDANQHIEDTAPDNANRGDAHTTVDVSPEETRSIIEVIATTGKFWHDWSFLKSLLSLQLKQVLAGYPEAQRVSSEVGPQQSSLSGETYSELVTRLNEALLRFEEGPPFTLQRLCEILLDPKGTYTKLAKLALALEKNLLVTSTITRCTDPYPATQEPRPEGTEVTESKEVPNVEVERLPVNPVPISNGTEPLAGDGDVEMADAEVEDEAGNQDIEMQEDKHNQTPNNDCEHDSSSTITAEASNVTEHSSVLQN